VATDVPTGLIEAVAPTVSGRARAINSTPFTVAIAATTAITGRSSTIGELTLATATTVSGVGCGNPTAGALTLATAVTETGNALSSTTSVLTIATASTTARGIVLLICISLTLAVAATVETGVAT
jgi:hypothetical protein